MIHFDSNGKVHLEKVCLDTQENWKGLRYLITKNPDMAVQIPWADFVNMGPNSSRSIKATFIAKAFEQNHFPDSTCLAEILKKEKNANILNSLIDRYYLNYNYEKNILEQLFTSALAKLTLKELQGLWKKLSWYTKKYIAKSVPESFIPLIITEETFHSIEWKRILETRLTQNKEAV